jgi:hypothetical protein
VRFISDIRASVTGGRHERSFDYAEFRMSNYRSLQSPAFFMLQSILKLSENRLVASYSNEQQHILWKSERRSSQRMLVRNTNRS